jgi:hypothetical protein
VAEIASLLGSWVTTTAAIFALLAWDERRLDEAQRARAWPVASRRCAVVVMGLVCVPVHFWRTRRSALGLILGIAWLAALVVVLSAAEWIVSAVVGLALGMD